MVYRGRVKKGVVVLDSAVDLADGTEVSVRPLRAKSASKSNGKRRTTLSQRLAPVIGKAKTLPPDASVNLDHYLYGLPKRK
jgi:hypothetical protein